MATEAGHWYYDMVKTGTKGSVYVQKLQGDADTWDSWATIRKANPAHRHLLRSSAASSWKKGTLLLGDTRLSARFKSYRLNLPTADESSVLLEVADYRAPHRP